MWRRKVHVGPGFGDKSTYRCAALWESAQCTVQSYSELLSLLRLYFNGLCSC